VTANNLFLFLINIIFVRFNTDKNHVHMISMKYIFFLVAIFFSTHLVNAQNSKGRRIYLTKGGDNGVFFTNGRACQPGDTLVLRSSLNPWSYVYMEGITGSASKPIVIINEGSVQLAAGFDIAHCQFIKLTGSGTKDKYGFTIQHSGGIAVSIHGRSANIEAERLYVSDCAFGVWIKNEANCDTTVNNWVLNNISVHDFQLKDIKIEGFYMGSTDPNNASRPISCSGEQKFYHPSKLGNIKVYNGIIDGTGRPAIMLCNAQYGMSEIYNNVITNVGREYNDQQGTGISLGMYTRAYVHHNTIKNTYTWGIASLGGSGLIRIENNKIENSGFLDGKQLNWAQNIVIDTRPTNPADTTKFIIINNQVSNPGKDVKNIEVWKSFSTYGKGNIICNNTNNGKPAGIVVARGVNWSNCGKISESTETINSILLPWIVGGLVFLVIAMFVFKKFFRLYRRPIVN
jgi:hypothetical protein